MTEGVRPHQVAVKLMLPYSLSARPASCNLRHPPQLQSPRQRWALGITGKPLLALAVLSLHLTNAPRVCLCRGRSARHAAHRLGQTLDVRLDACSSQAPVCGSCRVRSSLQAWAERVQSVAARQLEHSLHRWPVPADGSLLASDTTSRSSLPCSDDVIHNIVALSVAAASVKSMAGLRCSGSCLRACSSLDPSLLPGHAPQSVWSPSPVEQGEVLGAVAAGHRQVLQLRHDLGAARHHQAAEERDRSLLHPQQGTAGPASQRSCVPHALTLCLFTARRHVCSCRAQSSL